MATAQSITDNISIHEVAKTSTFPSFLSIITLIFQSTRSQRPRPWLSPLQVLPCYISIHEVAKTSTSVAFSVHVLSAVISIHEVAKTSTSRRISHNICFWYFNPRGRKDLDRGSHGVSLLSEISIHEVAKTSTSKESHSKHPDVFQSTRSQRPRLCCVFVDDRLFLFQSTRSQRPRQSSLIIFRISGLFQSTRSQRPRQFTRYKKI